METAIKSIFKEFTNASKADDAATATIQRRLFIEREFKEMGLKEHEQIKSFFENYITHNIYFPLSESKGTSLILCAHYDILNPQSENANDNSASIINLILLCRDYQQQLKELPFNLIIAFTSCEESGAWGAELMSGEIKKMQMGKVKGIINLELTGRGEHILIESVTSPFKNKIKKAYSEIIEITMPFSDSSIFRKNNLDAVTVSILSLDQEGEPDKSIWKNCHKLEDCLENISTEDMQHFRNEFLFPLLTTLANEYEK